MTLPKIMCLSNFLGVWHSLVDVLSYLFTFLSEHRYQLHFPTAYMVSFSKRDCIQLPAMAPKSLMCIFLCSFSICLAEIEMTSMMILTACYRIQWRHILEVIRCNNQQWRWPPNNVHILVIKLLCSPFPNWIRADTQEAAEVICGLKKHCIFHLTCFFCTGDTQAALWRSPCGKKLKYLPIASTDLQAMSMSPLEAIASFHPQSSLQMNATLANIWVFMRNSEPALPRKAALKFLAHRNYKIH